jgi:succinyl-CoA synthetase beta subunit
MKIHEYQAKELLKEYGVNVPNGRAIFEASDARSAAEQLGGDTWVVKAQIHAGGRGKAGGIQIAQSTDEVSQYADELLGKRLVTHQTDSKGEEVRRLYIEQGVDIDRELYLSLIVDRESEQIVMMGSTEGGVDIETVAEETPEKIHKLYINPQTGFQPFHARKMAFALGFEKDQIRGATELMSNFYKAFAENDSMLAEINPLVVTGDGEVIALDAKMNFDDSALYRHPNIEEYRDVSAEDDAEIEAQEAGLSYVNLDGNIGCMVNGAGLAMATMDIIKLYGGEPANFLDVGGGADAPTVTKAFKLITRDPKVNGIFINIFGGIMKCDLIANGVIEAVKEVGLEVPLVVRLAGTNYEKGKAILEDSDLDIIPATSMADGANKIVEATQ